MRIKVLNFSEQPDRNGDIFDPAGVYFEPASGRDVPVCLNYEKSLQTIIGYANLEKTEDGVYAEITPFPDAPDFLFMYPGIGGVYSARDGARILSCVIEVVGLSLSPNVDPIILTLEEQMKVSK
jgi:hypothetical protein